MFKQGHADTAAQTAKTKAAFDALMKNRAADLAPAAAGNGSPAMSVDDAMKSRPVDGPAAASASPFSSGSAEACKPSVDACSDAVVSNDQSLDGAEAQARGVAAKGLLDGYAGPAFDKAVDGGADYLKNSQTEFNKDLIENANPKMKGSLLNSFVPNLNLGPSGSEAATTAATTASEKGVDKLGEALEKKDEEGSEAEKDKSTWGKCLEEYKKYVGEKYVGDWTSKVNTGLKKWDSCKKMAGKAALTQAEKFVAKGLDGWQEAKERVTAAGKAYTGYVERTLNANEALMTKTSGCLGSCQ